MWNNHRKCSHILNILDKQATPNKGNLYLSGVYSLQEPIKQELGINCVLTIIDSWAYKSFKIGQKIEHNQIQHHKWFDLDDVEDEQIFPFFQEAHAYIKEKLQEQNVLVHCQMGISRSSSLVIAFLMKEFKMPFIEARALVKSKRAIIQPNEGFEKDLLKFQQHLKQPITTQN